ncbi:hypothetical protein J6590_032385 [Homalodisca vitripennis]|nr:hypothetical protein J6590_032385 [Homalodisca vitripennis]
MNKLINLEFIEICRTDYPRCEDVLILQKKALSIIISSGFRDHCRPIFVELGIEPWLVNHLEHQPSTEKFLKASGLRRKVQLQSAEIYSALLAIYIMSSKGATTRARALPESRENDNFADNRLINTGN